MSTVIFPIVLVSLGFFIVFYYFHILVTKRDQFLEEEQSESPIHVEVGGGRFDGIHYSPSFVKLRMYDEFMVISYSKKILLRYKDIDSVEITGWLWKAIRIQHHDELQPIKNVIFGSKSPEFLLKLIQDKMHEHKFRSSKR
jgi:hypothetical protein